MPRPEIVPFAEEHLDAAAGLLAERHRRHRKVEPRLPETLDLRAEIATLWAKEGASGAFAAGGYVLGTRLDDSWGPNVWIEPAGHAVREPELLRDLYGLASKRWVEEERTSHYAWVPAHDAELVDAWFRVGFGAQHAYGIRELDDEPAVEAPGVVVREAEERDVDAMVAIAPVLGEHQALAPVFSTYPRENEEETRTEIVEDLGNPEIGSLVAEMEGRLVGNFVVVPVEMSPSHAGLARPPGAAHIGFAVTLPEARGAGAGLALTAASFAWARQRGHEVMVTDWRVTNLLSSRFWPRRGFRTTFLRLHRAIA